MNTVLLEMQSSFYKARRIKSKPGKAIKLFSAVLILTSFFTLAQARAANAQPPAAQLLSVQELVDAAVTSGDHLVQIPPGIYRLPAPISGFHLQFRNLHDLVIDATGVTLILQDRTRGGIQFKSCNHVTLKGATIRYETPPFSQGTVKKIASDGSSYDVEIDKGYPTDLDDPKYFQQGSIASYLFDSVTRWWKEGTYDLYARDLKRLSPNCFRLTWQRPCGPAVHPVAVGDLIAMRGRGEVNLALLDCADMKIEGVTILNAGNFAVAERGGEGRNHYSFTVKRGSQPSGALVGPLFSSTADGFHSREVRNGPIIENSYLESMPDDGIAIHGVYSFVCTARGNRLVLTKSNFRPGDPIRIYDNEGRPADEAKVVSVSTLPDYREERQSAIKTRSKITEGPYSEVILDHAVRANFDSLADNPAAEGGGFVIRNNKIFNHRARGMLLKSHDGLVENNIIDGSTMGGIVLTPEFWWNESGYVSNITIRNNIIRHVAYAPKSLGGVVLAAFAGEKPAEGWGNRHIELRGNTFQNIDCVNLLITSSRDVIVTGNRFVNPHRMQTKVAGSAWGENPGAVIYVTEAKNIQMSRNQISNAGPFSRALIDSSPSAQVTGANDGVLSTP